MDFDGLWQGIGCEIDLQPSIFNDDCAWSHFQPEGDFLACSEEPQPSPEAITSESEEEEDDTMSTVSTYSSEPMTPSRRKTANLHSPERVEKNERERARIEEKGRALQTLKELITDSSLVDENVKKQRFTEEYTLKLTVQLINELKKSIHAYGRPPRVPPPLARRTSVRKIKKTPNRFLQFSKAMRPSFLWILKRYLYPDKSETELVNVQVDNREVTKFLSAVWRSLSSVEKGQNWKALAEEDKSYFTTLACSMIEAV